MTNLDVHALQHRLRAFAAERDWERFHSPKNLAMALSVEASELVELFQWLTEAESLTSIDEQPFRESLEDELADVLIYAIRLADIARVVLATSIARKIDKNATKHPPSMPAP